MSTDTLTAHERDLLNKYGEGTAGYEAKVAAVKSVRDRLNVDVRPAKMMCDEYLRVAFMATPVTLTVCSRVQFFALWDALAQFVENTADIEDELKEEPSEENERTLAKLEAARKFLEQMDGVAMAGTV